MKSWGILLVLFLTSCAAISPDQNQPAMKTEAGSGEGSNLPDLGIAPELTNQIWLNSEKPLRLADLHGKVVILDMWTYG